MVDITELYEQAILKERLEEQERVKLDPITEPIIYDSRILFESKLDSQ